MTDLLPPNATRLERAVDSAVDTRFPGLVDPIGHLWDPATCPIEVLPWLAWAVSIDRWDPDWSEARKRAEVARAIPVQRLKGTRWAVEAVLADWDALLELVEWWEATPPADPHTFEVRLPLDGAGGRRTTAAFAEAVIRDIGRAKPARSHLRFLQTLAGSAQVGVVGAARVVEAYRLTGTAAEQPA